MGAAAFQCYQSGADMALAYKTAGQEAEAEYGYGPYSGTIATTHGVRQVVFSPTTLKSGALAAERGYGLGEKWGAALAIPVAADEEFDFSTVTFDVTAPPASAIVDWTGTPTVMQTTESDLTELASQHAQVTHGIRLHAITVTPQITTRLVVAASGGRGVTRYTLDGVDRGDRRFFTTRAQALKAAKEHLTASDWARNVKVRPVRYFPEQNDATAATVKKETVSAHATVEAILATPKCPSPKTIGWLFYGTAAT